MLYTKDWSCTEGKNENLYYVIIAYNA